MQGVDASKSMGVDTDDVINDAMKEYEKSQSQLKHLGTQMSFSLMPTVSQLQEQKVKEEAEIAV